MKKISTLLVSLFIVFQTSAADWTPIRSGQPVPANKNLISSNIDQSTLHFSLDGFYTAPVSTPSGEAVIISLDDATPMLQQGAPDLPKMTASVIIPDLAGMRLEVIDASYRDFEGILVAPSKGNLTRDIDPATVPYVFGPEYGRNEFFPGSLAGMRDPHIVRDFRGQTVIVYPFQYNPVTRTLRVYTDITVRLTVASDQGVNPLVREQEPEAIDAQFSHIYQGHFLNYGGASRYTPVEEFGNMLIISYGAFMDAMQPFILWKKQMGYPVEMVDVGSIGNSSAIKSFIANYYSSKGLTFVLLVGDAAQVPTSSTNAGDSDNNYAYIVGNDHYPDLFIGRFSAETVEQVQTQVQRTLTYEQNPPVSVDWFSVCTGIASDQGPGDDGEYDYQHIRNIQNNKLIPFTYTYANELFDGSQGGNDAGGNPTPSLVASALNAGSGIINYTGHGSATSWGSSGFSNSDVNNLVNDNMLPFVWSVACVNGDFKGTTCFAEVWLRATHNGQPTGAVAFLGSTINQSWNPPMCGQDEMNDVLAEAYASNIKRTFGALSMHGCMLMNDEYGAGGDEMTDTWTCFGDPSVVVRTAMPQTMTVSHDPVLLLGMSQLAVTCNAEGGRATLTLDGTILDTEVVQGGTTTLNFAALNNIGTVTLTITGFNYLPYVAQIDVIPATGPYVLLDAYTVADPSGNGNGLPDYNESIALATAMKNMGVEDAENVEVILTASDPYITITDFSEIYPLIPAGQAVSIDDAFALHIASDVPDQHPVTFTLTATDGEETWTSTFIMKFNAPVIQVNSITVDDTAGGNGDGELDPGETAGLTINYSNTGHAVAYDVNVLLTGRSGFTEVANASQHFASIGFFGAFNKTFTIALDDNTPEGITIDYANEITMGDLFQERIFPLKVSAQCEDFETGDFSRYGWQHGGTLPWQIVNTYPYEGFYSIKSGAITHGQTSEISLGYEVMKADSIVFFRKVSSESSDGLQFFINNQPVAGWSGTTAGWRREAFPVEPGMNIFKWVYQKNGMGSAGSDCAWLDFIVLPTPMVLTLWAGPDDAVCTGESFLIGESYGTDYTQVEWTTAGSGTFDDNTAMHPVYTPSGDDFTSGEVALTLNLWNAEGTMVSDELLLGFTSAPGTPETPSGPDYVDVSVTSVSEYQVGSVPGAADYAWHLEPAEAGTIIGEDTNATVSWNVDFTGTAHIRVHALNECGDGAMSEAFAVTVDNSLVSVAEHAPTGLAVTVYPNPARDILNINVLGDISGDFEVKVSEISGREVIPCKGYNPCRFPMTIPVSHLQPGIYILTIQNQNFIISQKIMIR